MALVQLSNVVIPEVYASYGAIDSPQRTAFYESGILVRNPMLDLAANRGGKTIELPYWGDLDATREPNASNDDPADLAAPSGLGTILMSARAQYLNMAYSAADLVVELAGSDPMQRIRNRFGTYWTRQIQARLIASALGVMADNVASGGSDMIVTSATGYSRTAFVSAAFTLGDRFDLVSAIAVHSFTYQQMVNNDDITFIKPSVGSLDIATFLGKRVIVDDSLPLTNNAGEFTATSILFGAGAFGWGEGDPAVPVEVWRNPRAGNGGGVEELWERKTWVLHPLGYSWSDTDITNRANTNGRTGANMALDEFSPLLADLRKAANWERKVDRKQVPLAFLNTVTDTTP